MIEKMKKLTLLLYHGEKEQFLEKLRELGVVHVVEDPEVASPSLEELQGRLRECERVLVELGRLEKAARGRDGAVTPRALEAQELLEQYATLSAGRDRANQQLLVLRKDEKILSPWGDFDMQRIAVLARAGVEMRFYEVSAREFAALDLSACASEVIERGKSTVRFVAFGRTDAAWPQADAVTLPGRSLRQLRQSIEQERQRATATQQGLLALAASLPALRSSITSLKARAAYESVRLSMGSAAQQRLVIMRGWVSEKQVATVESFLASFCAWHEIDDAADGDIAPVKLVNPLFPKLFEPITRIFALPDYFELDPTPFFAPFFALFFGLCLGDMGYGLVLLVGAAVALCVLRGPSAMLRGVLWLLVTLGVMATVSGTLLNTFFGHAIFDVPGSRGFFSSYASLAPLSPLEGEAGTTFPAMPFAVYLGILQIMLGIVLNGVNRVRARGGLFAFGPLARLLLTAGVSVLMVRIDFIDLRSFSFGIFAIGAAIASLPANTEWALLAVGTVLLLALGNPDKKVLGRVGIGIWDLYQFATGIMGDGLSYLRLFALGLAGGMLGAAFNDIAFMVIPAQAAWYRPLLIAAAVLILVVGHTINFALALLGSFVHSLRLTFVEFYKNLEFKGGGRPFIPFQAPTIE